MIAKKIATIGNKINLKFESNIIIEEDSTIIRAKIVRQYKAIIFN